MVLCNLVTSFFFEIGIHHLGIIRSMLNTTLLPLNRELSIFNKIKNYFHIIHRNNMPGTYANDFRGFII